MFVKILLLVAPIALIALTALPKLIIQRRDNALTAQAVDEYRDTLPVVDEPSVEVDDLDVKWSRYWDNSRAEEHALRADLNDWVGWTAALEESFALECERVIKQFTVDAIVLQAETASVLGGWNNDLDRRSDRIVQRVNHNLSQLNHQLRVEVAECTDTAWSIDDARMLREYEASQEVRV